MRALLTLWWWQWVTSVHERLHLERDALWATYRPEKVYDVGDDLWMPNMTVTYESDDG